jgi:hypothetical protein
MAFVKPKGHKYVSLFHKCSDCDNRITRDEGYSNYTVEGTSFNCALGLHPQAPFDNFYGKAPEMNFAESCASFKHGPGLEIDVEEEALQNLTPHQRRLLDLEKTSMLIKQV